MDKINIFLQSQPRNRLVISKQIIEKLDYYNIGNIVCDGLKDAPEAQLSTDVSEIIGNVFSTPKQHPIYGPYVALTNIGVLFEPALRLNLSILFNDKSRESLLLIAAPYVIQDGNYYFFNSSSKCKINLKGITYIEIGQ